MEYRELGKTGVKVSAIGLGGGYLTAMGTREGGKMVRQALSAGINFFDTAPSYGNGLSESILGKNLGDKKNEVFVATKVLSRTYELAKQEITKSFQRLGKIDLLQLHSIDTIQALHMALGPDGAVRALAEAKEAGAVRFVGFTNHFSPEVALGTVNRYPFDTVMMPLGIINSLTTSFEDVARQLSGRGVGVIGILAFGSYDMAPVADLALRYALAQPAATIVLGARETAELRKDIATTNSFTPVNGEELERLKNFAAEVIEKGTLWWQDKPVGSGTES